MNIVVSLLSDQLTPNLLFIRQMDLQNDFHVFLTTKSMELKNKAEILANTLGLNTEDYKKIIIEPESPLAIFQELQNHDWETDARYIVNITGGTKIMSQMAFSFFQRFDRAEMYYKPLRGAYLEQLHPELKRVNYEESYQLSLKDYLLAHGYSFILNNELSSKISRAEALYKQVVNKKDSAKVTEIKNAQEESYYRLDKPYLTGGWFEEWLYYTIKTSLHLRDDQISHSLKLKSIYSEKNTDSDNEIDVAFVYNNNLYIIECKVFTYRQTEGKKINDTIYKISSIRSSMGLKATALVAILSDFGKSEERKKSIDYLCQMTGVKRVFSLEDMQDKDKFIATLKDLVQYKD